MLRERRSQSTAATGVASAEPPLNKKGQMAILRTMPSDIVRNIASVKANLQAGRLISPHQCALSPLQSPTESRRRTKAWPEKAR